MANEVVDDVKEKGPMDDDYLKTIEELKKNTVSVEEFNKLKEENLKLLHSVVDGQQEEKKDEPEAVDVQELRKELFNKEQSNLSFWEKSLKLREELIRQGKPDPFLPMGHHVSPTQYDKDRVENLVKNVQECIDLAQGDSEFFTAELKRRTIDAMPMAKQNF